jgi:hypothetical protein
MIHKAAVTDPLVPMMIYIQSKYKRVIFTHISLYMHV